MNPPLDDRLEVFLEVPPGNLDDHARQAWDEIRQDLDQAQRIDLQRADIDAVRKQFEPLSHAMLKLVSTFGHAQKTPLAEAFCPMAFNNRGATWLQVDGEIANPYFGHTMLRCGEIRRQFPPASNQGARADRGLSPSGDLSPSGQRLADGAEEDGS